MNRARQNVARYPSRKFLPSACMYTYQNESPLSMYLSVDHWIKLHNKAPFYTLSSRGALPLAFYLSCHISTDARISTVVDAVAKILSFSIRALQHELGPRAGRLLLLRLFSGISEEQRRDTVGWDGNGPVTNRSADVLMAPLITSRQLLIGR